MESQFFNNSERSIGNRNQAGILSLQKTRGPEASSHIKISFFERLLQVSDPDMLAMPSMAQVFPPEDFVEFSMVHSIEIDRAQAVIKGEDYEPMIKDGLLQRLWTWVKGFDRIGEPVDVDFQIPVAELHAPNVPGARTVYTIKRSFSEGVSLSVTIGGIGAGGSVTRKLTTEFEVPVDPGICLGLVCDSKALLHRWENTLDQRVLVLVDVTEVSNMAYPIPLSAYPFWNEGGHTCLDENAYPIFEMKVRTLGLRLGKDYGTAAPLAPFEISMTMENNDKYSAKWTLPSQFGESIGIEVRSNFVESAKGSFRLPAFYKYIVAYKGVDLLPLTWSTQQSNLLRRRSKNILIEGQE